MRKIIKISKIVFFIILMTLFVSTYSFAKAMTWSEIRAAYSKDKNIVNTLSKKELKEWEKEINAAVDSNMDQYTQFGDSNAYKDAELGREILLAIEDVKRK